MQRVKYNLVRGLIGVVSDTHIPTRAVLLPPSLFKALEGVELILHAGDLVEEEVLLELKAIAPVEAVAGNMDPPYLQQRLGKAKIIELRGGIKIGLVHGSGGDRSKLPQWAMQFFKGEGLKGIVFGHSHFPYLGYTGGVLLFNPGSPGDPRSGSGPSCGRLYLQENELKGEILPLY